MSTATPDPRPEILREAVDILTTRGRAYGEYYSGQDPTLSDCKVCVLGAIALAAGCDLTDMSLWDPQSSAECLALDTARAVAVELDPAGGDVGAPESVISAVGNWHDGKYRLYPPTDAEVVAALVSTADALERGDAR